MGFFQTPWRLCRLLCFGEHPVRQMRSPGDDSVLHLAGTGADPPWRPRHSVWPAFLRQPLRMKENRKSEGRGGTSQIIEFFHQRPENLLTVEKNETGVRICAACDNFSARDKEFFVRHLANEGFIPDRYRWFWDES